MDMALIAWSAIRTMGHTRRHRHIESRQCRPPCRGPCRREGPRAHNSYCCTTSRRAKPFACPLKAQEDRSRSRCQRSTGNKSSCPGHLSIHEHSPPCHRARSRWPHSSPPDSYRCPSSRPGVSCWRRCRDSRAFSRQRKTPRRSSTNCLFTFASMAG